MAFLIDMNERERIRIVAGLRRLDVGIRGAIDALEAPRDGEEWDLKVLMSTVVLALEGNAVQELLNVLTDSSKNQPPDNAAGLTP